MKFIAIYSSDERVTLRIFLLYSIYLTTTMICLSSVKLLYFYYPMKDFGKKILYPLSPETISIQPVYSFDFIWAGKVYPILIAFSSMVKNEPNEIWTLCGLIPFTTVPIMKCPGSSYFSKTYWFFLSLLKREISL